MLFERGQTRVRKQGRVVVALAGILLLFAGCAGTMGSHCPMMGGSHGSQQDSSSEAKTEAPAHGGHVH